MFEISRLSRLLLLSSALLVIPVTVTAQQTHADLSLDGSRLFTTNDPARQWGWTLRNEGPDPARDVLVSVRSSAGTLRWTNCPHISPEGCFFPVLGADVSDSIGLAVEILDVTFPGEVTLQASVSSPVHDPAPRNNHIFTKITTVRAPSLRFWISGEVPAAPGETVRFEASLFNDSSFDARDVRFSFHLPEGWSFSRSLSPSLHCTTDGREVACSMGDLEGKAAERVEFDLEAPEETDGSLHQERVTLTTRDGVFGNNDHSILPLSMFRELAVKNKHDDGEGSLRKAIETANTECGTGPPCRIVFEIPYDGRPVQTIQPLTPLPAIVIGGITIEGATQTERIGDTNADGPEIEINGSLLHEGNGFEFGQESSHQRFTVRNVVVNGFPRNGVLVAAPGTIENCFIGADATGSHPVPNGLRGVTVTSDASTYPPIELNNNLISGNNRSGVFVIGHTEVRMIGNRIGVAAGPELRPLPNGASGIYFGPGATQALVQKNVIAFNGHAGVGTARDAGSVRIRGNSIFGNGGLAIDHGLDGVSPQGISPHAPPVPVITSVRFDADSGITAIRGTWSSPFANQNVVEIFASDAPDPSGYGEAQIPIGEVPVAADNSFELRHDGDLSGRYVTATGTKITYGWDTAYFWTSEMSRAARSEGEAGEPIHPSDSLPRGADLSIEGTHWGDPVPAGVSDSITFSVTNLGPHTAEEVVVEIQADGAVTLMDASQPCANLGGRVRCALGTIEVAERSSVSIRTRTPLETVRQVIRAVVSSGTEDTNTTDNQAVVAFDVTAEPAWNAHLRQTSEIADPGDEIVFDMTLEHESGLDTPDVRVTLPIPEGWSLGTGHGDHWQCGQIDSAIVCHTPLVAAGSIESFTFTVNAPAEYWGGGATSPTITSGEGEPRELHVYAFFETWKQIPVTTVSDSGPGSLRSAIEQLNKGCRDVPCKIVFDIPVEELEAGAAVIRPLTPLPPAGTPSHTRSAYEIDGRTQPRIAAANAIGPAVVLNGSLLTEGDGLELSGRQGSIRGLTINSFPRDGVVVTTRGDYGSRSMIADNYIGTDPTGQMPAPNGRWGVSVLGGVVDVRSNVISGNGRSAVTALEQSSLRIIANQIGVAAGDSAKPVPNGASGIYLREPNEAEISSNIIANSAHFGVAISSGESYVAIRANSIFANGGIGIDYGLDSVTFNDDPDRPENLPPYPVLLSAYWDESVNATRVEGIVESWGLNGGVVEIFRNTAADPSGFGEAKELIAEVYVPGVPEEDVQHFSVLIERDLRGQVITSTWTRHHGDGNYARTSEISAAVPVE